MKNVKLCSTHINRIRGKNWDLQTFIDIEKAYVLTVQETKIDGSAAQLFPSKPGFSVFRNDHNLGGGVLLAIRQSLNPTLCLELDQGESAWAKVHLDDQVHYFCSFYCPLQQPPSELLHL